MLFCNVSDTHITRQECLVYGILYAPNTLPLTAYDFKLPTGVSGGMSSDELETIYGKPSHTREYSLNSQFWYPESPDWVVFITSNNSAEDLAEGTVLGFGTDFRQAVGRLIEQAGIAVSDEEADDIETTRIYEQDIAYWLKELQLSATDPERNNPTYIAQIKYDLGTDHYHLDNFKEAFEWMLQSAEAGNREAEYRVAVMYSRGDGVEQDDHAAASWYKKAALQGQPGAMKNLGDCYYKGHGVEQSDAQALQWWLKAAEDGFRPVYVSLAECYRDGLLGLKRDYKQAVAWYQKAADSNDPIGIYNLAYMYYNGYGVKRDYCESCRLLLDADMNQYYVQQALSEHYYYGRGVEKDIWKAAIHSHNFLDLLDNEDAQTREACAKEIKAARRIINKNSKVKVKTRRIK